MPNPFNHNLIAYILKEFVNIDHLIGLLKLHRDIHVLIKCMTHFSIKLCINKASAYTD